MSNKISLYLKEEVRDMKEKYKHLLKILDTSASKVMSKVIRAVIEKAKEKRIGMERDPSKLSIGIYISQEEGVEKVTVKME